jgi:hypothetical protein
MLTEQEAWQEIYDAFERYANGDFNRMAATGICEFIREHFLPAGCSKSTECSEHSKST